MDIKNYNPFFLKPEVVMFDLCGTLMDSKKIDHEAINYTLKQFGKDPWNITKKNKEPLKSMKDNFPNFFDKNALQAYDIYINYLTKNINSIAFFEDVSKHLQILKKMKTKTVVITNRDIRFIKALEKHREYQEKIKPYLGLVVTADEVGITKPSTKIIDYTLNTLNINKASAQNIVFIGDAFADMKVAIDYPCIPILLTATTADITNNFLFQNRSKIYCADTHKEIIINLMKIGKENNKFQKINVVDLLKHVRNRKENY